MAVVGDHTLNFHLGTGFGNVQIKEESVGEIVRRRAYSLEISQGYKFERNAKPANAGLTSLPPSSIEGSLEAWEAALRSEGYEVYIHNFACNDLGVRDVSLRAILTRKI